MSKYDAVLFDFDGTVADTSPGIKKSLLYAFEVNSLPSMTSGEMDRFIGPPLTESFVKYCGVSDEKAQKMITDFRRKYHKEGVEEFVIYEGLEDAFKVLKEKGVIMALATSKPEPMAVRILKKSRLYDYFDVIQGATLDNTLLFKADIVRTVLENPLIKGKKALMVGDTKYDIIGAHKNGIDTLWVMYGFGTYADVSPEKPEHTARTMEDMTEFFKDF